MGDCCSSLRYLPEYSREEGIRVVPTATWPSTPSGSALRARHSYRREKEQSELRLSPLNPEPTKFQGSRLLSPWHPLQRQVISQGGVTALPRDESEPYFHSRPHGSQLGAWASRQSSVLGSRDELDERYAQLERRWPEGVTVPMPEFWGGYRVAVETIEFWQGRVNRLHDRLRYRRDGEPGDDQHWVIERLAP